MPGTTKGYAINIARLIEDHAPDGIATIDPTGPGKVVEESLSPRTTPCGGRLEFKNRTLGILKVDIAGASGALGSAIKISRRVKDNTGK
jgi:hypothetical protein